METADGDEAWAALNRTDAPRMAILDWMMPGLDGVEICRRLNERQSGDLTYTLLLTAKTEKEDLVHALDNGAHDFLSKPVFPEELRSRIAVGRRLVEMNQLKNKFLGMAAHDMRNPISTIRNLTDLILDEELGGVSPEERTEFLEMISGACEDMLALIDDLLDIAAIASGRLELSLVEAPLKPVIEKRIRLAAVNASKKEILIEADLDESAFARFDPQRIAQVVDNLLSNAIKFSPNGATVRVALNGEGESVRISVADQGPGISPEDRRKLFGEFQKLSASPTDGEKTTGLGLAIVKKIVDAHQGRLIVESEEGKGAVFSFHLPRLRDDGSARAGTDDA
jgi:signal transduction histidine kinase